MAWSRRGLLGATAGLCLPPVARARGGAESVLIEGVTVHTLQPGRPALPDGAVLIDAGRIAAVGPRGSLRAGGQARRLGGRGQHLMPALADMHVHVPSGGLAGPPTREQTTDFLTPYLANGVLNVFNLSGDGGSQTQARWTEEGAVDGPRIFNAAMVDGVPPVWPGIARTATTPAEGREVVRRAAEQGFRFIKVYSRLDLETFRGIVDAAGAQGLKVVGHIPNAARGRFDVGVMRGFGLVAHAEEYAKQSPLLHDDDIHTFAEIAEQSGAWLTPTLTSSVWIARQTRGLEQLKALPSLVYPPPVAVRDWLQNNRYFKAATPERVARFEAITAFAGRLVTAFAARDVPLVAGTDSMIPGVVPGFALHDELELLAATGLPIDQVLAAATRRPAEWLQAKRDFGAIAPGLRADLLLLDADPLANVANTRRIAAVIAGGRVFERAALDARLADLARRNAATAKP